ncbi:hypothetical protein PRK78_001081 [Emydomyces testavorans]|uniref:IQ calmodulin-binding motif domain protein n=1 Tax=Emydomyces testavorans TaxID=2070801 RepID=A0AAF0IGF5_9EURO|nr:hypothetical protein PRK78_001081 [Emydomyces testavorans]
MMIRRNSDAEFSLLDAGVDDRVPSTSTPDEEDVEMISEDTRSPLTLPPHLIARFYPGLKDRRRAAASSSRRSSVSSLHSSVSAHAGTQSDHLVQHMRRASIIESRKARLADRAAHVEKVRLRAALAKNGAKNALKEERALAAQQAREKLLAEIAAKCEEEVRRAKKKAEDIKERKAAEHARLRVEMAEKFAEVERRRLLYQQTLRRPRRTSSAERKAAKSLLPTRLSQPAAACIIQNAWRHHRTRNIIRQFRSLDLSLERIRRLSFEEVRTLLSEETVISVTTKVLRLCGLQDSEESSMSEKGAVRVFLSSYLILSHPAQVLSSNGEQEQDLITKAQDLLVVFEQVITQLSSIGASSVSVSSDLQMLSQSCNTFFSAFHAWKSHDSTVLIEIMLAQFVELELIWQTVKNDRDGGVADDYQQGIRHNQILLLARLKRLAGPDRAMEMVKQALRKSKRERRRNGASTQAIPRAVTEQPSAADVACEDVHSPLREVFSTDAELWPRQPSEEELNPQDHFVKLLTALPDNRTLVHELLINREFKIDEASYTRVRRQLMKHMCDMMRKDVEAGLGTNWTIAMATVIQDRLLRSLKPGNSLHNLISEVLDPTYIENQCKAATFSYDAFFEFMSNILPKLCAPFRDPDIKAFAEDKSGDAIDRLAKLMGIIDLLSLDHTNFMLQMAAPQLIQEGPGYEQRAFSGDVECGMVTLERTRQFWRSNRDAIIEEMRKRDPENCSMDVTPSVAKIYAQGLVNLVLSNGRLSPDQLPETLNLDHARLEHLRSQSFKIAATAAILLSAKNLLKRDVRSQWKGEAERILSLDFSEIKPERIQAILDSTHPMPVATRSQVLSTIKRVLMPASAASATASSSSGPDVMVASGSDPSPFMPLSNAPTETTARAMYFTDPVAKLMLSRLRAHVLARLSAASARERVRTTSTASQSLAAAGMPEFVNEVGKLVDSLNRIREVDWMCHGLVYEKIWNEDAEEGK